MVRTAHTLTQGQPLIARSRDGAKSWTREYWVGSGGWADVFAPSADVVWGVGGPELFSTANACRAPAAEPAFASESYRAVHGTADGKRVWLVGQRGLVALLDRP